MKMKKLTAILVSAMLAVCCAGCSYGTPDGEYPVSIAGYTFEREPHSIVCLDDSVADILIACGYADLIKARSEQCTQEELEDISVVGSDVNPDVGRIISANPDVVFADKMLSEDVRKKLSENNVKVLTMVEAKNNKDLSVLYESVCAVAGGGKSGRKNGTQKAESVVMTMADLQRIIPESDFIMTACYLYDEKGHAAYDNTFAGNLFTYANAVNVCGNDDGEILKKLTLSNPQYIFCAAGVKEHLKNDEKLKKLNAVKNDRVYEIDEALFERQGNSITQVLSFMIETMYPELTENSQKEEISLQESTQESSEEESTEESSEESEEESSQGLPEESIEEVLQESSEESAEESSEEPLEIVVEADDSLEINPQMRYSFGEEDDNIAIIQQRLKNLGYFKGDITGVYDEETVGAVSDYEETNRIDPDGALSPPELYLLFSDEVLPVQQ